MEESRSSEEFEGRETSEGEREEMINMQHRHHDDHGRDEEEYNQGS